VRALRRAGLELGPVERGLQRNGPVARLVAEQRAIVLLRGPDDLAGVQQRPRVENRLDLLERARQLGTEERLDPFGAHQAVAVLARISALVLLDELGGFLGDGAHLAGAV